MSKNSVTKFGVKSERIFYILNPDKDLEKTQKRLEVGLLYQVSNACTINVSISLYNALDTTQGVEHRSRCHWRMADFYTATESLNR